jgi:hypothetical protein
MPSPAPKLAILSALARHPNFDPLASLRGLGPNETQTLLRWLDQSGLALSFLRRMESHETTALIPCDLHQALCRRMARNIERTRDLLAEFCRLNEAFLVQGVRIAALKGFTLAPDFCEEAHLRHQVDFDFLVESANVDAAAAALLKCGYATSRLSRTGESCFRTPLLQVPSEKDDLYAIQEHRQVDLHTSIWEDSPWISLKAPDDSLRYLIRRSLQGVEFNTLCLEDAFLVQVFHAFRHSFRSWVRLSWILEISRFLELHEDDAPFWQRVITRAGEGLITKRVFALVLGLATRLFCNPIPLQLRQWTAGARTEVLSTWLDSFSVNWSISDWPGSVTNIFLAADFILNRKLRAQYWKSRLLPGRANLSIGGVKSQDSSMLGRFRTERLRYLAKRSSSHIQCLLRLPVDEIRWKHALRAARTAGPVARDKASVRGSS